MPNTTASNRIETLTFDEFASRYCERQEQTPDGLKDILLKQRALYHPVGFMLLECRQFDSSRFASLTILPYGPNNTYHDIPDHPLSPRGLASDMSIVVAVLPVENLTP